MKLPGKAPWEKIAQHPRVCSPSSGGRGPQSSQPPPPLVTHCTVDAGHAKGKGRPSLAGLPSAPTPHTAFEPSWAGALARRCWAPGSLHRKVGLRPPPLSLSSLPLAPGGGVTVAFRHLGSPHTPAPGRARVGRKQNLQTALTYTVMPWLPIARGKQRIATPASPLRPSLTHPLYWRLQQLDVHRGRVSFCPFGGPLCHKGGE